MAQGVRDARPAAGIVPLMHWSAGYVGLPFVPMGRSRDGVNCWGLVALVYRERLGIELPSYGEISAFDLVRIAKEMTSATDGGPWRKCEPKEFAVAVMTASFTVKAGRRAPFHVGLWLDRGRILHVEAGTDACIVRASDQRIAARMLGTYELAR